MNERDHYKSIFAAQNGSAPSWLQQRRTQGLARFLDQGFPTPRLEDWKYTNVAALARHPFQPAPTPVLTPALRAAIDAVRLRTGHELVFVDGHYVAELSTGAVRTSGLTWSTYATPRTETPTALRRIWVAMLRTLRLGSPL